uniref:Translin-associated factor X-interacting protein 1 N-terminal domain-containing protein n=1 Tax=Denticeps clupeoides TaxID=299321 RepID=A0AAY4B9J1_9TELE
MSDIDIEVLNTVCEYIKRETARLSGREEQRFTIYTSAFDMVITITTIIIIILHSFAYKSVLTAIKKEYDEFISALRRKRDDAACVYRKMKAIQASCTLNYDLRAAQLQDRSIKQLVTLRYSPSGLTFDESMDPDALIRYMKCLEKARDNLLSRKQRMYRPGQVQAELDGKMVVALDHRDSLMLENDRLQLRLTDLFEGGEYEAAAFHAAKSPHGVLRNMETVERFKGDGVPPLLLFFKALTTCAHAGKPLLAEDLSVEAAQCALQHSLVDLVTHWIYQHRLTLSEALGDVIFLHQDRNVHVKDTCLVLAQLVYAGCGSLQKAVLCMCKRGLFCGSVEFIQQHEAITLGEEHILTSPSPQTNESLCGRRPQLQTYFVNLCCSVEDWGQIATCCRKKGQQNLAEEVMSALSQGGAICLSPGTEGLRLMEHVFM